MQFYERIGEGKLKCLLCSHYCVLKTGQTGFCKVNKNVGDEIINLCGNSPAAVQIDPVEKKPLKHFLANSHTFSLGSFGCNMRCPWCQNHHLSMSFNEDAFISLEQANPTEIALSAMNTNCLSISYTYNEPTVAYTYYRSIGKEAKKHNLKNIMISNGYQSEQVIKDMLTWVDACNIDLKSFNSETYKKFCKADLEIVKKNLCLLKEGGLHLEISSLIIPGINDSEEEVIKMAEFIFNNLGSETPWHLAAFHPAYRFLSIPKTSKHKIIKLYEAVKKVGVKHVYLGNV